MPTQRFKLLIIFLTVFVDLIGFGILIPVLPLYAKHFGATEITNGWLVGIYSIMQLVASPLLGRLSDRVGRRPVLFFSLIGTALGFFIMGWATTLFWLFAARIIDGISGGNISTAQAYIADITPPEDRSKSMGLIGVAFGLGFILGPAIGAIMSHISISAPFYFAGGLALVNAAMVYFFLPESLPKESRSKPGETAPLGEVFKNGWHLPTLMASYFFGITGFSIMTTNFALFTFERFGYDQKQNGYIFALVGLIGAVVQGGLLRRVLKTKSEKVVALSGGSLLLVGLVLLPLSGGLSALLIITAMIAVGNSFITPTLNGLASRSVDRLWQGRVIGLMQSAGSAGRAVGPVLAGWLLSKDVGMAYYGRTGFWAAAAIMLVAVICMVQLPSKPVTAE